MMKRTFLSLPLLVVSTAFALGQTGNEPRNVTQLYGRQALQTVRTPETVSAVLLRDRNRRLSARTRQVVLPVEAQRLAAGLLSTNTSYDWNVWKPCLPQYGARLILRRGVQTITVDFCFECDILSVTPAARAENTVDFRPSRPAWLRLFRSQFPKDKGLKTLR
jgi:hypothetical protein